MKKHEIDDPHSCLEDFEKICSCGNRHSVMTITYKSEKFHKNVYVLCECGEYIEFAIPVN